MREAVLEAILASNQPNVLLDAMLPDPPPLPPLEALREQQAAISALRRIIAPDQPK